MANIVFNCALGRVTELYKRVDASDPTNAVLVIAAFNTSATDATLRDLDTIAAMESDGNTAEATNSGYSRKVLSDSDLAAFSPDDTNNKAILFITDQTWTSVAASPGAWTDLCVAYDSDSTGGADSAIEPLTLHDFAVTPDGSDITADFDGTNGFYQASSAA